MKSAQVTGMTDSDRICFDLKSKTAGLHGAARLLPEAQKKRRMIGLMRRAALDVLKLLGELKPARGR